MTKNFILNADDFGMSLAYNKAVLDGYNRGLLKSASLCANGEAFDEAFDDVIKNCPELSTGVHLNIIEGKSLTEVPMLTDDKGLFNKGYFDLMKGSLNKEFLLQTEKEFRAQIEKIISKTKITHIDSHVHTHAIPNLFKLTAKLADEYKIPYIRTQFEHMYFVPSYKKYMNLKYPINIIKIILLNTFTKINLKTIKKYNLKTNDYLIGVGYTGMMDVDTVKFGIKALENKDCLIEALIHPCNYEQKINDSHYTEFLITQNEELKKEIELLGFNIISCCPQAE